MGYEATDLQFDEIIYRLRGIMSKKSGRW